MSKLISPHITVAEYACQHCGAMPPSMMQNEMPVVFHLLFSTFEDIRAYWKKPIKISSGYRCPEYQMQLVRNKQTDTPYSAHVFGLALDLDVANAAEVLNLVQIANEVDPDLRIGYKKYLEKGQSFVHIDMAYLIYPKFHPAFIEGKRW